MNDVLIPYSRKRAFYLLISFVLFVFTARLIQLQLLYKDKYGKMSEENSIRTIAITPLRGYMYDRNGVLVVDNRPSYTVTVTPAEFNKKNIDLLANILMLDKS
jgi:penicillin-binding protein 2